MASRNKLSFLYFLSAVALFALGYGLAWFSEQAFFSQEIFPKHQVQTPTPSPSPTPSPTILKSDGGEKKPSAKPGRQYTVQSGDTISKVAEANGIGFEELASYNNIPYPYNLEAGQIIVIPQK